MNNTTRPIQDPLNDLRIEIVHNIAMLIMASAGLMIWWAINVTPIPWASIIVLLIGFTLGWWHTRLLKRNIVYTRIFLLILANMMLFIAMMLFESAYLPFIALTMLFPSALLMRHGELITLTTVASALVLSSMLRGQIYPLRELSILLSLGTILSWILVHTLYTALQWYSVTYSEVRRLLDDTRTQRSELKRTLHSLKMAYELQQRIQQELTLARKKEAEAQRMKERFVANISHELRTPLNLIFGFSKVMHFSPEVYGNVNWTPLLSRDVFQIYRSSRHLMEMIDDILDLSYSEHTTFSINLEKTDFRQFMDEAAELARNLFHDREAVIFESHIPHDLPTAYIDRTRIRQVILNLLNNARRFTENGRVKLRAKAHDGQVVVSVEDTGAGIPEEAIPNVFDEYYQVDYSLSRKHGGAGLGLTISKRFIEAHQGTIYVESIFGQGSNFTFSLPLDPIESEKNTH